MGLIIDDGLGKGNSAGVNSDQRLMTNAETNLSGFFASRDEGLAFNTISENTSSASGTVQLYFKNTSPTRLFFVDLLCVSGAQAGKWRVWEVTGTASGTTGSPANLNLTSNVTAEAEVFINASVAGLTLATQIATVRNAASQSHDIPFDDTLILGQNDAIGVEYDTGTTGDTEILMRGFYKDR